jgi:ATP-dependent Clp protease protease subunit
VLKQKRKKIMVIPTVSSDNHMYDLFSRLLKDRIIILSGEIDEKASALVVSQLLFLQSEDKKAPILMYINSPGGSVTDGLAIIDTMNILSCPVETYCVGSCASMGSLICAAGKKGKRYILEHGRMMIHQVSTGSAGTVQFVKRQFEEANKLNDVLITLLADATNKPKSKILKDIENDYYMSAEEAVAYGLVDKILKK